MLLRVDHLNVSLPSEGHYIPVVRDVSFTLAKGQVLGILGESGAGKTQLGLALMGLSPKESHITGEAWFEEYPLLQQPEKVRGKRLTMMFQDPLLALNPYLTLEQQLTEGLIYHEGLSPAAAREQILNLLSDLQITAPEQRLSMYPFELSGGTRQRVMLAMALATRPDLLIADEPTTALDTTVQSQVLTLLKSYQHRNQMAIVLISHDLGVLATLCDTIIVMYGGIIVEQGPTQVVLTAPQHPYTQGLLAAAPKLISDVSSSLPTIPGQPPHGLAQLQTSGCAFFPRCSRRLAICNTQLPVLQDTPLHLQVKAACHAL